jgi:hypothetical protein
MGERIAKVSGRAQLRASMSRRHRDFYGESTVFAMRQ